MGLAMQYYRKVKESYKFLGEVRVSYFEHLLGCKNSAAKRLTSQGKNINKLEYYPIKVITHGLVTYCKGRNRHTTQG
jgi:hypothetical protein